MKCTTCIKTKTICFLLCTVLMITLVSSAFALTQDILLQNNTGITIYYLYMSPVTSTSWEEDMLGDNVLISGKGINISFTGYANDQYWDMKVVDSEGVDRIWYNLDLSTTSKITLTQLSSGSFNAYCE